ncbi:ABC transporter permease [Yersinia thracica]|uniref:ABC transporter permease n=1 Tax=Yersinia thracica TaxID=2890319 RepID=UPI001D0D5D96|nr:ABC transporter permease [Yersinia thracica]
MAYYTALIINTCVYNSFLCSGIILWNLFSEVISKSVTVFIRHANIIKKINFPKICLPVIILVTSSINFILIFSIFSIFSIFFLFLVLSSSLQGFSLLYIVPIVILTLLFSISFGMIIAVLNVFFRDVGQFIIVVLQFWFWLTPIVYPVSILPVWVQNIIHYNPLTGLVILAPKIFVLGEAPLLSNLLPSIIATVIFSILGLSLFRKYGKDMVDEL